MLKIIACLIGGALLGLILLFALMSEADAAAIGASMTGHGGWSEPEDARRHYDAAVKAAQRASKP